MTTRSSENVYLARFQDDLKRWTENFHVRLCAVTTHVVEVTVEDSLRAHETVLEYTNLNGNEIDVRA